MALRQEIKAIHSEVTTGSQGLGQEIHEEIFNILYQDQADSLTSLTDAATTGILRWIENKELKQPHVLILKAGGSSEGAAASCPSNFMGEQWRWSKGSLYVELPAAPAGIQHTSDSPHAAQDSDQATIPLCWVIRFVKCCMGLWVVSPRSKLQWYQLVVSWLPRKTCQSITSKENVWFPTQMWFWEETLKNFRAHFDNPIWAQSVVSDAAFFLLAPVPLLLITGPSLLWNVPRCQLYLCQTHFSLPLLHTRSGNILICLLDRHNTVGYLKKRPISWIVGQLFLAQREQSLLFLELNSQKVDPFSSLPEVEGTHVGHWHRQSSTLN